MPVQKIGFKWRWGDSGKLYDTKAQAEEQGRAIEAAKAQAEKDKKKK